MPRTITQCQQSPSTTQAYEGEPAPGKASTERPRVGLIAGASAGAAAELAQLLRKRLLIITVGGAVTNAVDRAVSMARSWTAIAPNPLDYFLANPIYIAGLAIVAVYTPLAFLLRARRDLSVGRLRLIEGI